MCYPRPKAVELALAIGTFNKQSASIYQVKQEKAERDKHFEEHCSTDLKMVYFLVSIKYTSVLYHFPKTLALLTNKCIH